MTRPWRIQHSPDLKPARSRAELIRVRQGWVLIFLAATNVAVGALTLLKVFGVI